MTEDEPDPGVIPAGRTNGGMVAGGGMARRLASGVGANAIGQLVIIALQLLLVPVLASQWGLERYGLWLMLATIPNYLAFSDLGFGKAACVDMTMCVAVNDREGAQRVYQSASLMIGATAVVLLALLLGICFLLPDSTFGTAAPPGESRIALALLVCYGMIALGGSIASGPLQSTGRYAVEAICLAAGWALEGIAVIVVVLAGGDMIAAAATYLVCRSIGIAGILIAALRLAPWLSFGVRHARLAEVKRLMRPAAAMMVVPLANSCVLQGTAMAIGLGRGAAAVPAFTTTRTLSRVAMQATGILVRATMPEFSRATARHDRDKQLQLILVALLFSAALLVPLALLLVAAGSRLILLWTHGVVHVPVPLILTMTAVLLANGFWVPLSNLVMATNRQAQFTYAFLALAIASIFVTYFLSRHVGALAGGIGMLMVDATMLAILARIVSRQFGPLREILGKLPEIWQLAFAFRRIIRRS